VDVPEDAAPTKNLRVFKKVDILFVNDPGRTVAILEELLDQVRELEHSRAFLSQDTESTLRQFIRFARFELQQPINLFDFKPWCMHACGRTIDDLQSWADNPGTAPLGYEGKPLSCTWPNGAFRDFAPSLRQDIVNGNRTNGYGTVVILVKVLTGKTLILRVQSHTTIPEIKTMIYEFEELPVSFQCLIYRGRKLEDRYCVSDYNVSTEYYIHLVLPYRAGSGPYYDQPLPKWLLYDGGRAPSTYEVSQSLGSTLRSQQILLSQYGRSKYS
jgi:Ubiquitin family